eukprot:500528-Prymnesium_polylepis.1
MAAAASKPMSCGGGWPTRHSIAVPPQAPHASTAEGEQAGCMLGTGWCGAALALPASAAKHGTQHAPQPAAASDHVHT